MSIAPGNANQRLATLFKWITFLLVAIYLLNCFGPLHIHFDSIRYFNLRDCMAGVCAPDSAGATDYLPYGYTANLFVLSKVGLLNAFTITFTNILFLLGAIYFVRKMAVPAAQGPLFFLLVLFNWTVIKFVTHPLSEMQFMFFSFAGLYAFHLFRQQRTWLYFLLALALCFVAMLTRTIGIALFPALFLGLAETYKKEITTMISRHKKLAVGAVLLVVAVIIVAILFYKQLGFEHYLKFASGNAEKGFVQQRVENLQFHLLETAEVTLNIPSNKVFDHVNPALGKMAFIAIGVIFWLWALYTFFTKRKTLPFFLVMYLLFYFLIIFNWPYYDPRFLTPVLPLMIIVLMQVPVNKNALWKWAGNLFVAVYIFLGAFAVAYSTYIAFKKEAFAKNQARGVYRNEYETHFFGKPQSDTATHIDKNVLDIITKYD
jgi:hypothetical protein